MPAQRGGVGARGDGVAFGLDRGSPRQHESTARRGDGVQRFGRHAATAAGAEHDDGHERRERIRPGLEWPGDGSKRGTHVTRVADFLSAADQAELGGQRRDQFADRSARVEIDGTGTQPRPLLAQRLDEADRAALQVGVRRRCSRCARKRAAEAAGDEHVGIVGEQARRIAQQHEERLLVAQQRAPPVVERCGVRVEAGVADGGEVNDAGDLAAVRADMTCRPDRKCGLVGQRLGRHDVERAARSGQRIDHLVGESERVGRDDETPLANGVGGGCRNRVRERFDDMPDREGQRGP